MYHIWNQAVKVPKIEDLKEIASERVTVKPFTPEKDGYIFLHGLAIASFKGKMYCTWAHNKVLENSDDEEVNFSVSEDGGKSWSPCRIGNLAPEGIAVSHGSFLADGDSLYFFAPQFKGQLGKEMLRMHVYRLDEAACAFTDCGIALCDRFWPMCEPVLMDNGCYLMAGIYVGDHYRAPNNVAAVAISRGSDILHWDMVKIPKKEGIRVWGECTVTVDGSRCCMYCREHSGKHVVLYAESNDFGASWSEMDLTDMPMIGSKPYAGTLSNGRRYLISSCAADIRARDPLTIALTDVGEDTFRTICKIDSGRVLSYPYAVELDGKLYVAYSATTEGHNRNSAELAIIPLEELTT
jgi:hypothetical protein